MGELKPCPFCGGEATVVIAPIAGVAYVECKHCSAMMGRYHKGGRTDHDGFWTHFESKDEAIEAWNRRVDNSAPTENGGVRMNCETCLNSRPVMSENGFHRVCCLSSRTSWNCIIGKKDRYVEHPMLEERDDNAR